MSNELTERKNDNSPLLKVKYSEYDLQKTIAETLVPIAKLHGFKSKIRFIEPQGGLTTKKDGIYLIVSKDKKYIDGADGLTGRDLYQEYINQSKRGYFYPNVMVFKVDQEQKLNSLSHFIDSVSMTEFFIERFREWKIPNLEEFLIDTKEKILSQRHASVDDIARILNTQAKKIGLTETPDKIKTLSIELLSILSTEEMEKGEKIIKSLNDNLYPTIRIPEKIENNSYRQVYFDYRSAYNPNATEEERNNAAKMLDYHLSILESGLGETGYLEANKNNPSFKFKDMLFMLNSEFVERQNYKSTSEKNIPYRQLIESCDYVTSCAVQVSALEAFEESVKNEPGLYYCIDPYPYIVPKEIDYAHPEKTSIARNTLFNKVSFNTEDSQIILANIFLAEHPDVKNRAKYWVANNIDNVKRYAISFPAADFNILYHCIEERDINYCIDMNGVYADATLDTIGIVTENYEDMCMINDAIKEIYNMRAKYKICGDIEEMKQMQKIEQKSQRKLLK